MKLKELQKLSKTVRTVLIGLFMLGFSIVITMMTGVILFQNELLTTLQFIVYEAFSATMLAVDVFVFDVFKDIDVDIQTRLNKILKRIRKKKYARAKAIADTKAHTIQNEMHTKIANTNTNPAPNLQVINIDQRQRKHA